MTNKNLLLCMLSILLLSPETSFGQDRFRLDITQKQILSYFEKTYDVDKVETVIDDDWVTDLAREAETRTRIGLVIDALTAGRNLDYLEEYGLFKSNSNSYTVVIAKDHNWLTLGNLFFPLKFKEDYEKIYSDLSKRGFDRADLQELKLYLEQNGFFEELSKASMAFQKENSPKYVSKYQSAKDLVEKSKIFFEWTRETRSFQDNFEYEWAIGIYSRLDDRAQNILCSYLSENISDLSMMDDGVTIREFEVHLSRYVAKISDLEKNTD